MRVGSDVSGQGGREADEMVTIPWRAQDNVRRAGWLALASAVMTVGLITYGAWVRASGSGLGCPDWPLCQGDLLPALEGDTAVEFGHRVYAGATMIAVAGSAFYAYLGRGSDRLLAKLLIGSLLAIVFQAVLGGVTVLTELDGNVRLAHLSMAMVTLGLLTAGAIRGLDVRGSVDPGVRVATGLLIVAVFVVLVGGSIVGSSVSGACPSVPFCDERSPADAAWLHGLHRAAGTLLLIALVALAVRLRGRRGSPLATGLNHAAAFFVVVQIGVGVAAVTQELPTELRVLHLGIATLIWWSITAQWLLALKARSA